MFAPRLHFGIKTAPQHTTYEDILRVWEEADGIEEVEHAWLFDHFVPLREPVSGPCLEGWSLLAALAARTKRLRVGVMVTGNTYRHPAVLANMGATVDLISRGRLDLGLGAGWHENEHRMYGIPLYAPAERIRRLEESCTVIEQLWTNAVSTFTGRYYQLEEATCEPKPVQKPHPPILIGGSGEQLTLRVVARHAAIWNFVGGSVEQFQHKSRVLDAHCEVVGRDPASIERSVQILVNPLGMRESRDAIRPYIAAGATHIVLNLAAPYPAGIVSQVTSEIIAPLTAELS